jgi:hypothetical protein
LPASAVRTYRVAQADARSKFAAFVVEGEAGVLE